MLWSTVSNAAERSNNSSTTQPPLSIARKTSFWTLSNAVSVLCPALYADWNSSSKLSRYNYDYNYCTFSLIYFTLPNQYELIITLTQATSITHLTCTLMLKNKKVTTHVNPKITAWSNGLMSTSVSLMCCWIFSSLNFTFAKRVSSFRATSYETKNRSTQSVTSLCKLKSSY